MFVLLEGAVDVRVGGETVEQSARGALLGEMALIDRSPRGATVIATAPSRLPNGKVYVLSEDSDFDDPDTQKELILTVAVRAGTPAFTLPSNLDFFTAKTPRSPRWIGSRNHCTFLGVLGVLAVNF